MLSEFLDLFAEPFLDFDGEVVFIGLLLPPELLKVVSIGALPPIDCTNWADFRLPLSFDRSDRFNELLDLLRADFLCFKDAF